MEVRSDAAGISRRREDSGIGIGKCILTVDDAKECLVLRKFLSGIYLLTAISIGLGAFGHGSQWSRHMLPTLKGVGADVLSVLVLVWYWVSGAMLVFGVLLILAWWGSERGDAALAFVPWIVGAFYLVAGIYGAACVGAFFFVLVVQAMLLFATTWALRRRALTAQAA
jgi:hypothetical protein